MHIYHIYQYLTINAYLPVNHSYQLTKQYSDI